MRRPRKLSSSNLVFDCQKWTFFRLIPSCALPCHGSRWLIFDHSLRKSKKCIGFRQKNKKNPPPNENKLSPRPSLTLCVTNIMPRYNVTPGARCSTTPADRERMSFPGTPGDSLPRNPGVRPKDSELLLAASPHPLPASPSSNPVCTPNPPGRLPRDPLSLAAGRQEGRQRPQTSQPVRSGWKTRDKNSGGGDTGVVNPEAAGSSIPPPLHLLPFPWGALWPVRPYTVVPPLGLSTTRLPVLSG